MPGRLAYVLEEVPCHCGNTRLGWWHKEGKASSNSIISRRRRFFSLFEEDDRRSEETGRGEERSAGGAWYRAVAGLPGICQTTLGAEESVDALADLQRLLSLFGHKLRRWWRPGCHRAVLKWSTVRLCEAAAAELCGKCNQVVRVSWEGSSPSTSGGQKRAGLEAAWGMGWQRRQRDEKSSAIFVTEVNIPGVGAQSEAWLDNILRATRLIWDVEKSEKRERESSCVSFVTRRVTQKRIVKSEKAWMAPRSASRTGQSASVVDLQNEYTPLHLTACGQRWLGRL